LRVWAWGVTIAVVALVGCGRPSEPTGPTRSLSPLGRALETGVATDTSAGLVVKWSCVTASDPSACPPQRRLLADATAAASAPAAPSRLAGTVSGSRVSLTWQPPAGDAPTSYVLEAGSTTGQTNLANFDTGTTLPSFIADDVPSGTYYVRVRGKNAAGIGPPSNEIVVPVVGCAGALGAPTGLAAIVAGYTVMLTWTAPVGTCLPTSYFIQAGSAPGLSDLASADLRTTATSYTASGVEPGQYYVRIRGLIAGRLGDASNELFVSIASSPLASTSFLAFGDSITEGESGIEPSGSGSSYTPSSQRFRPTVLLPLDQRYPTVLQQRLVSRYRTQMPSVTNVGLGGEAATDPASLSRLATLLSTGRYGVVLIMEGTNDLFGTGQTVQTVTQTVAALRVMLQAAKARGVKPYLATIAPMNPSGSRAQNYSSELVPAMNDGIRALARSEGVELVDVNQGFNNNLGLLGSDGVHPNADGYAKIADVFYGAIKATLEIR